MHSSRLERWLGKDSVEHLSLSMKDWYGPPIAVHGVPGNVIVHKGGGFSGRIDCGEHATNLDFLEDKLSKRESFAKFMALAPGERVSVSGSFGSLSALLLAGRSKRIYLNYSVVNNSGVLADVWYQGGSGSYPPGGSAASAAPGGTTFNNTSTGAMKFENTYGSLLRYAGGSARVADAFDSPSVSGTLLLYDRLFSVLKTASTTTAESITGVPTRYQNSSPSHPEYSGGNFVFPVASSIAGGGPSAHNWTVCQYTNQAGTTGQSFPSVAGVVSLSWGTLDMGSPFVRWFMPLASDDTGVRSITQLQCSASISTQIDFVIGHPIAFLPCPLTGPVCQMEGIITAFNMAYVHDNAALTFLSLMPSSSNVVYTGDVVLVAE